jgi:RHS repeat-associated protein
MVNRRLAKKQVAFTTIAALLLGGMPAVPAVSGPRAARQLNARPTNELIRPPRQRRLSSAVMVATSSIAGSTKNTDIGPRLAPSPTQRLDQGASRAPNRNLTVDIFPGRVTTFAGDGQVETVDGVGTAARFSDMGGSVVVGGYAYIATTGAIRKVDLSSANVTTLAGGGTPGCTNSSNHSAVQFSDFSGLGGSIGSLDSDGTYLYDYDGLCGIRRVDIATGATTQLATGISGALTVGPDGYVYVATGSDVMKVDPSSGSAVSIYTFPHITSDYESGIAIASDDTYLWVGVDINVSYPYGNYLLRIPVGGGSIYSYKQSGAGTFAGCQYPRIGVVMGTGQLLSAGDYLYASTPPACPSDSAGWDNGVERITKPSTPGGDLTIGTIAGSSTSGYSADNREWGDALFSGVRGLASDSTSAAGGRLWVVDSGNHRLRKITMASLRAREFGPPEGTQDASVPRATAGDPVDTANGNFYESATDISLPGLTIPFTFTRYYNSLKAMAHTSAQRFGSVGWSDSFDASVEPQPDNGALVFMPNGQTLKFASNGSGGFTADNGIYDQLTSSGGIYTLTQPDQTKYHFDSLNRLQDITDRDGHALTLHWSSSTGKVDYITDSVGRQITFDYDPTCGAVSKITLPDGRHVDYVYGACQLTYVYELDADGNGQKSTNYIWAGPFLSSIKRGAGSIVTNVYGSNDGRITSQTTATTSTSFSFADGTNTVTRNGHSWVYVYSNDGELQSVTDPYSRTTSYSYDIFHNPLTIQYPGNQTWTYTYNAVGRPLTITPPIASAEVTYEYNNSTFQTFPTSFEDGRGNITRMDYDSSGDLQCQILPPSAATTCNGATQANKITYTYTDHQPHVVTDQNGNPTTYDYYPSGSPNYKTGMLQKVTTPKGLVTSYDYSFNPLKTTMVTPQGNANNCQTSCAAYTWTYNYDDTGRLTSVANPVSPSNPETYVYDSEGNLASVTDADSHHVYYGYLPGGQACFVSLGVSGSCSSPPAASTSYVYDGDGGLWKVTDGGGHTTTRTYWNDGQLHTVADPLSRTWSYDKVTFDSGAKTSTVIEHLPSTDTVTTTWDAMGGEITRAYSNPTDPNLVNAPNVQMAYDDARNLCNVITGGSPATCTGATKFTYDQRNQMLTAGNFTYTYDDAGNLKTRTYPDTKQVAYTYDGDNRLCGVNFSGTPASTCSNGTIYIDYSQVTNSTAKITKSFPNGQTITNLDKAGRVNKITNKYGSSLATLSTFDPTLSPAGFPQTVAVVNNGLASGQVSETQTYTFDPTTAKLKEVCYDVGAGCSSGSNVTDVSFTYDGAGNITSRTIAGGASPGTTYYGHDAANQLCWSGSTSGSGCNVSGDTPITYNANGDQLNDGTTTYTYDLAHRLTKAVAGSVTDTYSYDPLGNRSQDQGATTTDYTWDPNASVAQLATTKSGSTSYDFFNGSGLQAVKSGSSTYYYDKDQTGSVANIVKHTGTLEYSYAYQPYGKFRANKKNDSTQADNFNPMTFDSEYRDTSSTGLIDLRARMYSPGIGSFLQSDPASGSPSYEFVNGNPTMFFDPSGQSAIGDTLWEAFHNPVASWNAAPTWSKGVAVASLTLAAVTGVTACALATAGICAGFTVFGLGNVAAGGGTATFACEEFCDDAVQTTWHGGERLSQLAGTGIDVPRWMDWVRGGSSALQADGSQVFMRAQENGRWSWFAEGVRGVITAHNNYPWEELAGQGQRYGWRCPIGCG